MAEVLSFAVSIGFVVLFTVLDDASWTLGVALCVLFLYFYIRNLDTKNDRKIADASALKLVYEKEVAYQTGDYTKFDAGERYLQPTHPFTFDLDVFGQGSLFQRINRTISLGGSDYLAESLSGIFAYCGTPKTHRTTCGSHRRTRWERTFPVAVQGTGSGKADRHCCRERSFRKHSRIADTFLLRQSYLPNTYLRQPCGLLPQHFPLYRQLRACVPSALVGHFQLFPCHILHPQVHKIGERSHI